MYAFVGAQGKQRIHSKSLAGRGLHFVKCGLDNLGKPLASMDRIACEGGPSLLAICVKSLFVAIGGFDCSVGKQLASLLVAGGIQWGKRVGAKGSCGFGDGHGCLQIQAMEAKSLPMLVGS